jgi:hypothetical protein
VAAPKMTIEDLYDLYGHLQGQIAATTNLAAATSLHPDKETIERVIQFTASSNGYQRVSISNRRSVPLRINTKPYSDVASASQPSFARRSIVAAIALDRSAAALRR